METIKSASMAFQLKDGNILLIDKEDIKDITMKIVMEGAIQKTCVILREKDQSIEKANMLYNILKNEKNISQELREKYLLQIGELLSTSQKSYIGMDGNEYTVANPEKVASLEVSQKDGI